MTPRSLRAALVCGALLGSCSVAQAQVASDDAGVNHDFFQRLARAYLDELNPPAVPATPAADAPVTRRPAPFPPQPLSYPPYPFTDWNYGGSSTIGASLPNQVDSPLTTALWGGPGGDALKASGIQIYGWIEPSFNVSTSSVRKNGNAPAAYDYMPNTAQLNQATLYIERVPDTVQRDHVDWGFRITGLYGTDYRYTTARGFLSNQLLGGNHQYGFDVPMAYGEIYIPQVAQGMVIRAGRYISLPDIEAQLAPNNYMFSHSMLYTFDPYTNLGVTASVQLTRNWMVQASVTGGNDIMPTVAHDPGVQPSVTACLRYNTDSSSDSVYACANTVNSAKWGYNNLNHYVLTYYHAFNERLHLAWETYYMDQKGVPNLNVTGGSYADTPFSSLRNPPNQANCNSGDRCRANTFATLAYLNYKVTDRDNLSLRAEFFDDQQGQRTGFRTRYVNGAVGWQHFFSPSIIVRPELAFYDSVDARAFNAGRNRGELIAASDLIFRF